MVDTDESSDAAPGGRAGGRWSQERRLEFIDCRLCWDGRLNRADLTDFFGISVPQASLDIARYIELAPKNLEYDKRSRAYLARDGFRARFPPSSPERLLSELLAVGSGTREPERRMIGFCPPVAIVPNPTRRVDLKVLIAVQRAIREGEGLRVVYQSLTRAEPSVRAVSPHALAHDGYRWHVRAYCHVRNAFRDFVLARVLEVQGRVPHGPGPKDDVEWNTMVRLLLRPHRGLPKAHRRAIELDYGMVNSQVELKCRQAHLFYVLRHLRIDEPAATPQAQQIELKNAREVDRYRTKPTLL
jgi:predicted DNA-binding transcriptional regulator YafY